MKKHDIVTIDTVTLRKETDRAYLFDTGRKIGTTDLPKLVWIPKSECEWDGKELQLPQWLAEVKELV